MPVHHFYLTDGQTVHHYAERLAHGFVPVALKLLTRLEAPWPDMRSTSATLAEDAQHELEAAGNRRGNAALAVRPAIPIPPSPPCLAG